MNGLPSRDQIISQANSLPDLVSKAQAFDPAVAAALTPKALIASKTPIGIMVTYGVTWLASKYALDWDPNFCALAAGLGVLAASYVMRYVTTSPIAGIFKAKPLTPAPGDSASVKMPTIIAMLTIGLSAVIQ